MIENKAKDLSEKPIELKKGNNVILMPELMDVDEDLNFTNIDIREAVNRLQNFFDEIASQGGRIVGIVPVVASVPYEIQTGNQTITDGVIKDRQIAIVIKD